MNSAHLPPYDQSANVPSSTGQGTHGSASPLTTTHLSEENITLTWSGDEILGPAPVAASQLAAQAQPTVPHILPPRSPSPVERPPDYTQAQRPRMNVCYSFSPLGANGMVLLPPATAQDTRPQYFISVTMNCFMPLSHITTVYRGANEYGARVGEFEMGIINAVSRVQIGNQAPFPIAKFLTKSGAREEARWAWNPVGRGSLKHNVRWDYSSHPYICRAMVKGNVFEMVAKFTSHLRVMSGVNDRLSQLEVTPGGQEIFDDILMSLLIIERKRLTPKTKSEAQLKDLFN